MVSDEPLIILLPIAHTDHIVIERVKKLLADIGIGGGLAAHKVTEKDVAKLAAAATVKYSA